MKPFELYDLNLGTKFPSTGVISIPKVRFVQLHMCASKVVYTPQILQRSVWVISYLHKLLDAAPTGTVQTSAYLPFYTKAASNELAVRIFALA